MTDTENNQPIVITRDGVIAGLGDLVEEYGDDYIYPRYEERCVYVFEGEPDCMVGKFLANKGVPVERLKEADANGDIWGNITGASAVELVGQLENEGIITISSEARKALQYAQIAQDGGETWGAALQEVIRHLDPEAPRREGDGTHPF